MVTIEGLPPEDRRKLKEVIKRLWGIAREIAKDPSEYPEPRKELTKDLDFLLIDEWPNGLRGWRMDVAIKEEDKKELIDTAIKKYNEALERYKKEREPGFVSKAGKAGWKAAKGAARVGGPAAKKAGKAGAKTLWESTKKTGKEIGEGAKAGWKAAGEEEWTEESTRKIGRGIKKVGKGIWHPSRTTSKAASYTAKKAGRVVTAPLRPKKTSKKTYKAVDWFRRIVGTHFISFLKLIIGTLLAIWMVMYFVGGGRLGFDVVTWIIFCGIFFCIFGMLEMSGEVEHIS